MNRAVGFIAAVLLGGGCGDNFGPPPLTEDQLMSRLRALPGVTVEPGVLPEHITLPKNVSYYVLHFTQPVDHDDPTQGQGTFQQEVSLLHRNDLAPTPMIVNTSGYADAWGTRQVELTQLLDANQVSIEHRFYGTSRPDPTDWSKLTIKQMAQDEHAIIAALSTIYDGPFLTTGASKGGMTAVFHRRFYPDDVVGTVAYVAPLSFGAPDPRYPPQFNKIGTDDCRAAVRSVAGAMLAHRDQIVAHAEDQARDQSNAYTRVAIGPAVEAAIAGIEWGFWQMQGVAECSNVPLPTASDDELFEFLDKVSPVSEFDDDRIAFFEPYVYQSYSQLGYPDGSVSYLAPDMMYSEADYLGELPTNEPAYDSDAMRDIDDWVEHHGDRLLFIYGDWDPWFAGRFVLGDATNSQAFIQHEGTHRAQIKGLDPFKRDPALAMIKEWTGVEPVLARLQQRRAGGAIAGDDADRATPRVPLWSAHAPAAAR